MISKTSIRLCFICVFVVAVFLWSRLPLWMQWELIWVELLLCAPPLSQQHLWNYQSTLLVSFVTRIPSFSYKFTITHYKCKSHVSLCGYNYCDLKNTVILKGKLISLPFCFCPLYQSGLAPLCENMPSGKATKPGDVVTAKNGKTIQVSGLMKYEYYI